MPFLLSRVTSNGAFRLPLSDALEASAPSLDFWLRNEEPRLLFAYICLRTGGPVRPHAGLLSLLTRGRRMPLDRPHRFGNAQSPGMSIVGRPYSPAPA
jgi:hypothetical protein